LYRKIPMAARMTARGIMTAMAIFALVSMPRLGAGEAVESEVRGAVEDGDNSSKELGRTEIPRVGKGDCWLNV
jgi:hypothetical protein